MISPNSTIELRPYRQYKKEPERYREFLEAIRPDGRRFLYFHLMDKNYVAGSSEPARGFSDVAILTNQNLRAGDKVIVKQILGIKFFRFKRTLYITILDADEQKAYSKAVDDLDFGGSDF